jgi:type I restriction enzyme S subunit
LNKSLKTDLVRNQITSKSGGSTRYNIGQELLSSVIILFPSLNEQQKIASFLSLIDERIHTQSKIIEQLETLIKGLSEKLFSQKVRFKEFPNDWQVKTLGEIATFYSGGTPLTSKKEFFDGNIPFIRSGEINSDKTEQFISEVGLKNSSAKMVEVGDVLYALYGATSGEVGISKIKGAINQAILCIRSTQNHYFIYSYLLHKKESIIKTYLQGGQGNLSADIVKQIKILIPSIEEQTKIASFLSKIDQKIQTQKAVLEQLEKQKKYLLQNMFV